MKVHKRLAVCCTLIIAAIFAGCGGGAGSSGNPSNNTNPGVPGSSVDISALGPGPYKQLDRLNRPLVNEGFAMFAEHQANNVDTPNDDAAVLGPEIMTFMTGVAGRSTDIAAVVRTILTPDVQIVNMNGTSSSCIGEPPGTCNNYLGIETKGVTQLPKGTPFGGRALTDDVVDLSLGVAFGKTIAALGLAPDDNNESDGRVDSSYPSGHRPNLTTDNVSWQTAPKHFTKTFPYLGAPR